jgi:hypothetical protein
MATIPAEQQKRINDLYNQRKTSELAEYDSTRNSAVNQINAQKTQTNQQFYDTRNQADVVNFQNRKALQEMMASQGLGNSGENISANVGLQAARQNTLGSLNREEQNILGSLNSRITELNDPTRRNSIISAIEAQRSQSLADAMQRAIEMAEQQRQFNEQLAWQKEQFRVQQANRGRSGGGGGGSRSYSAQSTQANPTTQTDQVNQMAQKMLASQKSNQSQGRLTPATYTTPWYEKNKNIYGDLYSGF